MRTISTLFKNIDTRDFLIDWWLGSDISCQGPVHPSVRHQN